MIQTGEGYNPFPTVRSPDALISFEVIPKALIKENITVETAASAKMGAADRTVNGVADLGAKYGTLERFGWKLDGSCSLIPSSGAETGFWTEAVSGSDGIFSDPIKFRYEWDAPIDTFGWTFHFDAPGMIRASQVRAEWFDANGNALGEIEGHTEGSGRRLHMHVMAGIEPVQDLHWKDHPWAPGAGKNLYNKEDGASAFYYYNSTQKIRSSDNAKSVVIPCEPNTTYTASKEPGERFSVCYTKTTPANGVTAYGAIINNTAAAITITTGEDAAYLVVYVWLSGTDTATLDDMLDTVQIEKSDHATPYEPYSNICPITGWTAATVNWRGGNIFTEDGASVGYRIDSDGTIIEAPYWMVTDYIDVSAYDGVVAHEFKGPEPWITTWYKMNLYDADKTYLETIIADRQAADGEWLDHYYDTNGAAFIRFECYQGYGNLSTLEAAHTVVTDWSSAAGTVYGGSVDVMNGLLTVTHGQIASYDGETLPGKWISDRDVYSPAEYNDITSTLSFERGGISGEVGDTISMTTTTTWQRTSFVPEPGKKYRIVVTKRANLANDTSYIYAVDEQGVILKQFINIPMRSPGGIETAVVSFDSGDKLVYVKAEYGGTLTVEEINGGIPTTGAQVVYELAEPLLYELTPSDIWTTVEGGTVAADCGPAEVEYIPEDDAVIASDGNGGWSIQQFAADYCAVEFTFYGTNEPFRMLRLVEVDFGISRRFSADSVTDMRIVYGTSIDASAFPAKELTFTFDNSDGEFNVLSPAGVYQYWRNGQVLRAKVKIGNEIVNMGMFTESTAEIGKNRLLVKVRAHDQCYHMDRQKYYPDQTILAHQSVTLKTAVEDVLAGYDLKVNYNGLENELVSCRVNENHPKRAIIRYLAQAARASVWIDRENTLQFRRFAQPSADDAVSEITADELYDWSGVSIAEEFSGCVLTVERELEETESGVGMSYTYTSGESEDTGTNTASYENPCIAPGQEQAVCDWLLAAANWRKKYAVKNRCDPAVEIGDALVIEDAFHNDDAAIVTGLDVSFNGVLSCVTEAEGVIG